MIVGRWRCVWMCIGTQKPLAERRILSAPKPRQQSLRAAEPLLG